MTPNEHGAEEGGDLHIKHDATSRSLHSLPPLHCPSPTFTPISSTPYTTSIMQFTLTAATLLTAAAAANAFAVTPRAAQSEIDDWLKAHNDERAAHGAAALTWNQALADKAADWANGCVFEHSNAGQNLAATFST